jgi:hypothetical protein
MNTVLTPVSDLQPGVDTIERHVRSYRSALQSTLELTVNSLTNSQLKMDSILHPFGNDPTTVDIAALVYSLLRLPSEIDKTHKVIIGQTPEIFASSGFNSVESWPKATSIARRRKAHFNPESHLLAVFAASISDVDDITNLLIAYQSEWNKFHLILKSKYKTYSSLKKDLKNSSIANISVEDWSSLISALGINWQLRLRRIYRRQLNLRLQLLAGSLIDYTKATQKWWKNIATTVADTYHISRQQIYFVSSNNHSLLNLVTGFVLKNETKIIDFIKSTDPGLYSVWQQIETKESLLNKNDFLYFAAKFYLDQPKNYQEFLKFQQQLGLITVPSSHYLDLDVQLFPVKSLANNKYLDPRLKISKSSKLNHSEALIFNINYPLGFSAYHVLNETLENVAKLKGLYILGKAAVLNSEIGDIEIPRLVFDEHTQNTYMFKNCFNTFFPFLNNQGSILTNQKSVSVLGTFLENEALLDTYSKNNLTVIEMESGPYLNAVTENCYDQQTPRNTIIDLNNAPFDIGIVNYTSDTPYSKAKNLGVRSLSLDGIEPVYLGSLAILQRIINLEENP